MPSIPDTEQKRKLILQLNQNRIVLFFGEKNGSKYQGKFVFNPFCVVLTLLYRKKDIFAIGPAIVCFWVIRRFLRITLTFSFVTLRIGGKDIFTKHSSFSCVNHCQPERQEV